MSFAGGALILVLCCIGASHALTFNCQFETNGYQHLGNIYECIATVTNGTDIRRIESVSGTHATGKKNSDVGRLTIDQQNLATLPYNIANYFPNLISIRVVGSNLQAITSLDFQPFRLMTVIDLRQNKLTSLESGLFEFTPGLKWVSFDGNQLDTVGRNLATGQSNLDVFNFKDCKCINREANSKDLIVTLNADLPISCPAEVIPASCPAPCKQRQDSFDSQIKKLEDEISNLTEANTYQTENIVQLRDTIVQQSSDIQQQSDQIAVLEDEVTKLNEVIVSQAVEINQLKESIGILRNKVSEVGENSTKANEGLEKRLYELETKVREILSLPGC